MAKSTNSFGFLAYAICFLSLFCFAYGEELMVEGKVYCDTCRVQFITKLSTFIEGATVKLECKDREGGKVTFSKEATTDKAGHYEIKVEGDHEEELCEVVAVKSPQSDCNEMSKDKYNRNAARISLTSHNGIASGKREANPTGFLKKGRLPECVEVLREMGITSAGLV
ncbi:Pollen Ole e 1 allergen and extensin family protein [Euphorbia peplus]|nr:Pollen Ole e 1 allergen and extensin family protein [Euphorbia peplus]